MAAVYKSLSKTDSKKPEAPKDGAKKNKQRVLILSSRGVTFRYDATGGGGVEGGRGDRTDQRVNSRMYERTNH